MILITFVLFGVLRSAVTEVRNKGDGFVLFPCYTTDIECFRRQYLAVRTHIILGNTQLGIRPYQTYLFQYADSLTCVKITGVESSQLKSISVDSRTRKISMVISMPVHVQQVRNTTMRCDSPEKQFSSVGPYNGPLKKFSGNATIDVFFPYIIQHRDNEVYFELEDENLDVVMDIPDLSHYDRDSELERKLYEWSEWAYEMVQHVDVAEHVILPYIDRYKVIFNRVPFTRFILLYPDETYTDLQFRLSQH